MFLKEKTVFNLLFYIILTSEGSWITTGCSRDIREEVKSVGSQGVDSASEG